MTARQKNLLMLLLASVAGCGQQLVEFAADGGTTAGTAPTVTSTIPAAGASSVCIPFEIEATFDTAMDASTITTATFTVSQGATPVAGAVSYDAATMTASFLPSSSLLASTTYTATITTGVKDAAGNALAANRAWSFTPGTSPCLLPVNLRSLSTFVAVAGAGLTNSNSAGATTLNGDVGLSPTATCLGDGVPCTATDPVINGTLYANDPAGKAATAKDDLVLAYDDATSLANRPRIPANVRADLSGQTLPPGVYWSASTMLLATGGTLTLDGQGDPNAAWIFQVGSALTVNADAQVVLTNGARAANVFWAVGSSSTLLANVKFKGTVLAQASNSVGTGSTVDGRLLCATGQLTLLSDTISLP